MDVDNEGKHEGYTTQDIDSFPHDIGENTNGHIKIHTIVHTIMSHFVALISETVPDKEY